MSTVKTMLNDDVNIEIVHLNIYQTNYSEVYTAEEDHQAYKAEELALEVV